MKTLAIVAPAYNEEEGIEAFYRAVKAVLAGIHGYASSICIVVDGGEDRTFSILRTLAAHDPALSAIKLSRNFGHQPALLAGLDSSNADVFITMDADLQHPPELIPRLLEEYERGNDIVFTVRERTADIGFVRRIVGALFYRFLNVVSDVPILENACDFRLMSHRAVDVIRDHVHERNLFLRGIAGWIGFRSTAVQFSAGKRRLGKSKYSLVKLVQFALSGLVSFTKKPLRAAIVIGILVAGFGFFSALFTIGVYFFGSESPSGWATVVVLISMFSGIQLIFLGIIGEYLGVVFDEVKARPRYIVDEAIGIDAKTR